MAERSFQRQLRPARFSGTLVLDFFGNCVPIYRIDDPFEVLPKLVSSDVLLVAHR